MTSENDNDDEVDLSDFEADGLLTEDLVVNSVMFEDVKQIIRSKPEDVQKIFYLMYEVGLTISEIAEALSITESGVKNKLYRTLKELRNLLN
jgi:RNA polymerase sigma-70 factor (ECF subfamily)